MNSKLEQMKKHKIWRGTFLLFLYKAGRCFFVWFVENCLIVEGGLGNVEGNLGNVEDGL